MAMCVIAVVDVAMPMLVSGRAPDHVTCADFDAGFAIALRPAASSRDVANGKLFFSSV